MDEAEATTFIAGAVRGSGGVWADLGAGTGTFTKALAALLGPEGRVYAVERDATALGTLARAAPKLGVTTATIVTVHADFTEPLTLPPLDGVLLANALHYVAYDEQLPLLSRVVRGLKKQGRLVVVDYDGRRPNRWVPFPVSIDVFRDLASELGLTRAKITASRPSAYGGTMFAAYAERRAHSA
jgi:ubiquinone/menaquinone biosynthesis C-methylase UbiE